MSDSIIYVSASQLRHAADLKEKIENLQHEFEQILGAPSQPNHEPAPQKKRQMSAAARARIAAGARARWAKIKGTTATKPAAEPQRKRKMSPAAKARLAAIARARWKKARAAGRKAL